MKTLSFADLHYSKENREKCFNIIDFISGLAENIRPDFITNSGDLLDKAIMNSETHGLPDLKRKLDDLSQITPIVMIYGTPGKHDIPGSLEIFKSDRIHIVYPEEPLIIGNTIFYCIPDAKKWQGIDDNQAMSAHNMNRYLSDLCKSYAAHRLDNRDKFAIVLGHGIVKNHNPHSDEMINKSEIYTTESDLALICAEFYAFGHYHNPYEFKTIPGCMLGGFAHTWKDLNYKPAITEYYFEEKQLTKHKIDFISKRIKIKEMFGDEMFYDNELVWLEKGKDAYGSKESLIKCGAHPDSFVTVKPELKKIIRNKEITACNSRTDEYKSYAKQQKWEVSQKELDICAEIEKEEKKAGEGEKKNITPVKTYIKGFAPFYNGMQKESVYINWGNYDSCLLGILGDGGEGKSALLSCIPPHSVNIAQIENFNNMFILPDSFIIQEWLVNNDTIILERFFEVKEKKTTVSYKVKVNDELKEEYSGTKANYDLFVDSAFGSPRMFALNVFQTQFKNDKVVNGAPVNPDICIADNSTLKSIFTELLNIDRTSAFNYSKNNYDMAKTQKEEKANLIEGFKKAIDGKEETEKKLSEIKNNLMLIDGGLCGFSGELQFLIQKKENIEKQKTDSEIAEKNIDNLNIQIKNLQTAINKQKEFKNYSGPGIEEIKNKISELEKQRIEATRIELENQDKQKQYNKQLLDYNQAVKDHGDIEKAYQKSKSDNEKEIQRLRLDYKSVSEKVKHAEEKILLLNKPCEHCGKLSTQAESETILLKESIEDYKLSLKKYEEDGKQKSFELSCIEKSIIEHNTKKPTKPIEPQYKNYDKAIQSKLDSANVELQNIITIDQKAAHADQEIERLTSEIYEIELKIETEKTKVLLNIKQQYEECKKEIDDKNKSIEGLKKEISTNESELKSLTDKLELIDKKNFELNQMESELSELQNDLYIWVKMCQAWGRDGIPAMILENAAPEVDFNVNDLLSKYYPKLMVETSTIRLDATGKKTIEDFNINIINTETGNTFPISGLSGEQRNFIITAFREVCRNIYERTGNRIFNVGIIDEGDSHVCEMRLPDYWNMVKDIDQNKNRLRIVVSHSPTAKEYFEKSISIREVSE